MNEVEPKDKFTPLHTACNVGALEVSVHFLVLQSVLWFFKVFFHLFVDVFVTFYFDLFLLADFNILFFYRK